jgi:hypothetical protein
MPWHKSDAKKGTFPHLDTVSGILLTATLLYFISFREINSYQIVALFIGAAC